MRPIGRPAKISLPACPISVSSSNRGPTISGARSGTVDAGSAYSFRSTARDGDNEVLKYSVANRPAWASFNSTTGQLFGWPTGASAGAYSNIVIGVSDGKGIAALNAFSISVTDEQIGAAALYWQPPPTNTDGSALTNLAGCCFVYGASPTQPTQTIQVASAGIRLYVVENLAPGTHYFALRAYTTKGAESADSNVVANIVR